MLYLGLAHSKPFLYHTTFIAKVSLVGGALGWVLFTTPQGLGWVLFTTPQGGVGFVPVSVDSVPLDYCDGPGECRSQRFGVLYSKFEFAVQDAIKTPKLKPRSRKRVLG